MTKIYLRLQALALENAQQKGEIQTLAVIASFIKAGATLRWGYHGWEIRQGEILVPTEFVEQLHRLGSVWLEPNPGNYDEDAEPSELVKDLLSSQHVQRLDETSRHRFQAVQNRAYFEYLDSLVELYRQHSPSPGEEVTYVLLARERFQFWYHFAWLYLAGTLHLFGTLEHFRVRVAQRSLDAISPLIG